MKHAHACTLHMCTKRTDAFGIQNVYLSIHTTIRHYLFLKNILNSLDEKQE